MFRDILISRFYSLTTYYRSLLFIFNIFITGYNLLPASSFALILIAAISGTVQSFSCNLKVFHV